MLLAENIKKIREEKGISREHLAEHMGVTPRTVKTWEDGKVGHLTVLMIEQISECLGVPSTCLMGWE